MIVIILIRIPDGQVMGFIAVIVNCGLIGLSGPVHRIFPNITGAQTVIVDLIMIITLITVLMILIVLGLMIKGTDHQLTIAGDSDHCAGAPDAPCQAFHLCRHP